MPFCVETTWALLRARFFSPLESSGSTLNVAETHMCVNGLHKKVPLLLRKPGACGAYGLQKNTQKTLACRRLIVSEGPNSTKGTVQHRGNEDLSSAKGMSRFKHNEEDIALPDNLKESPPSSRDNRPHAQSFSSVVLSPPVPPPKRFSKLPPADQAFFILGSISFMVCGAFIAFLATAIPTLNAMKRAALSLERLANTVRHEVPGTMAAIRLSGMEISDLTLELSDLSQDISESVRSSARAVRAAEVGIRRMGSAAASQTLSMLQEHASAPVEAVKPVVVNAAETTRHAMSQAHKAVLGLAGMPVLSNWIQRKKIEEQQKIDEDMDLDSIGEFDKQDGAGVVADA